MSENASFEGKIVFVTGAASGLGRATATAYARVGANLALLDINRNGLEETRQRLRGRGETLCIDGDLADPGFCGRAIDRTVERFGGLDVLCNVAGVVGFRAVDDVDEGFWRRHFAVNLDAPFRLSQAALPHLRKRGGNIVNVASSAALVGEAFLVPYAASKAALVHMTKSMAMEVIKDSVRINAIAPGPIDTPIMAGQAIPANVDGELVQRYVGMREASTPDEIANLILFVSSPLAKSIHGACLSIDGGISAG